MGDNEDKTVKPGPKPRQRAQNSKLSMIGIECTQDEKEELLRVLNAKLGNSTRSRFEFFQKVARNIDVIEEYLRNGT